MRIFDEKFKSNVSRYIIQSLLAMVIIFVIFLLVETFFNMTIVASLGASTFIALTMPHGNPSRPRYFIGGYVVGAVCGASMNFLNSYLFSANIQPLGLSPVIFTCALAVGFTMFLMTILDFEHPPAAALALGLVPVSNVLIAALIAIACIAAISAIKALLKRWLIDLA